MDLDQRSDKRKNPRSLYKVGGGCDTSSCNVSSLLMALIEGTIELIVLRGSSVILVEVYVELPCKYHGKSLPVDESIDYE